MPIYEYGCPQCGRKFERLQGMKDSSLSNCPDCGAAAERLLSTGAAIISKGGSHKGVRSGENCERESPCCGKEIPCEKRPCDG